MENLYDVIVVGGGPAGLTAALYLARAKYRVLVLEKLQFGGQISITNEVVNYPGIERTSGQALTDTMQKQAAAFGAEFMLAEATAFDLSGDIKTVHTNRGDYRCFGVLLATGAHPRTVGFKGEEELKGRGVAYCATCDGAFYRGKRVAVVGGGDTAAVDALFLSRICRQVILVHRRGEMRAAKAYRQRLEAAENVEFVWNSEVTALTAGDRIEGITVRSRIDGSTQAIPCDGVFIAVGTVPNTQLFRGILDMDEAGYLSAGEDTRTNLSGVFAVGDARRKPLRQVLTAAADGAVAAYMAEEYLMRDSRES